MPPSRILVGLLRGMVVVLSAQFLLGIYVNLFGAPSASQGLVGAAIGSDGPVLAAHVALAVVLLLLGGVLSVLSFGRDVPRALQGLLLGGLLSIVAASLSGAAFVLSGFGDDTLSFSMATAFIAATSFYGVAQAVLASARPGAALRGRDRGT